MTSISEGQLVNGPLKTQPAQTALFLNQNSRVMAGSQRIHGTNGIFTYINGYLLMVNVGKYTKHWVSGRKSVWLYMYQKVG